MTHQPVREKNKKELQRQLAGYTAMAGAVLASASGANAAPVGKQNQEIMILPGETFDLDVNNDGVLDIKLGLLQNEFSTNDGFNVGNSTRNLSSGGLMATIRYANYSRRVRSASFAGNAYASRIGPGGQVATSGAFARKLDAGSSVDAALMASGAQVSPRLGSKFSDYFYNQNGSFKFQRKIIYTAPGGEVQSTYSFGTHVGGYQTGPRSTFYSGGSFPGTRGFLGIEFDASGSSRFGWIDVELAGDYSWMTVHGWGFETRPNTAIQAGAVPEPQTLAGLALGAAGVLALKRLRRNTSGADSDQIDQAAG